MKFLANLGHVVSDEGKRVDNQKIEVVNNWPRDLHCLEGFSSIVAPLTMLTHKETKFKWSDECERSFQELKIRLNSTHVLVLPESTKGYAIYCDASRVGLGCVLI